MLNTYEKIEMQPPVRLKPAVSVFMYHQVGHFNRPKTHRADYCDVDRFKNQMWLLKLSGYTVISLSDACKGVFEGADLPPRPAVLTFDDGYQDFDQFAWPILNEFGYPATVFLVSRLIGAGSTWDMSLPAAALMSSVTIRRLHREGVNFGSHTLSHCRLSQLSTAEQRKEIFESKSEIENILGEQITDFCYPYGDYDLRSRDLVAEANYSSALTCIRGAANGADNRYEIPRKAISYGDNMIGFLWKLYMKNRRKDNSCHNPEHLRNRH